MKYLIICGIGLSIVACTTNQPKFHETPECRSYRGMMTAPMPPSEIEKLRLKCEQSNQK